MGEPASDWWRTWFGPGYLALYDETLGARTPIEIDQLEALLRLRPPLRILDLPCGQGRHALDLARRGFANVVGVDRSAFLLKQARARAQAANLPVTFHAGDCRAIPLAGQSFDAVLVLGNSFGYFDSADDDGAMLRDIHRILHPAGMFLLDITDGTYLKRNFEARSWEWIGNDMFTCRERVLSAAGDQLITREMTTHVQRGVIADRFYAERLYGGDEMRALLTRSGFDVLNGPAEFASTSTRNQDLGMMARRLLLVAQKR